MKASQYLMPEDVDRYELTKLPVFQGLHHEDLEQLLSVSRLKSFADGEKIIDTGSTDTWLYILLSGKVVIEIEEVELTVIHEYGALFGETALIDDRPRQADVVARGNCICLSIDIVLMQEVLCTTNLLFYAHFYKEITKMLSKRVSRTSTELALVKRAFQHILEHSITGDSQPPS